MASSDSTDPEFEALLLEAIDGELSEAQASRLQDLGRGNQTRLETLVDHSLIVTLLIEEARSESVGDLVDFVAKPTVPEAVRNSKPLRTALPWAIAAVLCVALIVERNFRSEPLPGAAPEAFVGLLVDEANAEFELGYAPDSVRFDPGEYRLREGAVHVRLENGADLMMKSPVAFRIEDAFRFQLLEGGLSALIPPSAQGFTVSAPGIEYEDLGTEFGVAVDPQTGISELHVFDGQVDAKSPGTKQILSSVMGGESVAFANGSLEQMGPPRESDFLPHGSIGFLRWQYQSAVLEEDPDLLALYSFSESGSLKNSAKSGVAGDGAIEGARWVAGRWPGKSALLFDRDTDFVEVEIPGEYEELTFSTWLKLDRLDHGLNSIFNSRGREEGDVHWEVRQDRSLILVRRFGEDRISRESNLKVPMGQWVHLAGTLSVSTGESRVYLNGEFAGKDIGPLGPMTLGVARLGQWDPGDGGHRRELRGRMDEFAIWQRALTGEEIKKLTEEGKPNTLWPTQFE